MQIYSKQEMQSLGYKEYLAIFSSFVGVHLYNFLTELKNSLGGKAHLEIISAKSPA